MNPSTALATALVDALVDAGVREVVLCPGSRSSAMAYAVWSAERAGRLRLHVRVDERSAAFLALGLAKVSRRPAVVVTTSGTAVANLHPAVLEARHALVPLIVVSTDRPARLRGSGANQTTRQPGLFGWAPRYAVDLPADGSLDEATAQARAAVLAATACEAEGPVHLNIQFDEPLVPDLPTQPDPSETCQQSTNREARQQSTNGEAGKQSTNGEAGKQSTIRWIVDTAPGSATTPESATSTDFTPAGTQSTNRWIVDTAPGSADTPESAATPESATSTDLTHARKQSTNRWIVDTAPGRAATPETAATPESVTSIDLTHARKQSTNRWIVDTESGDHPHGTSAPAPPSLPPLPARTLVVLGDLPTLDQSRAVLAWARRRGLPVLAEPFGAHPRPGVVAHGVLVAGTGAFVDQHEPDAIVVAGRPTLSRPYAQLIRRPRPDLYLLDAGLELDIPGRLSQRVNFSDHDTWNFTGDPTDWCRTWLNAGRAVGRAVAAHVNNPPIGRLLTAATAIQVARALAAALPDDALVFLGSSNTPRDLDAAAVIAHRVDVVASRGLAGIDGCVATAVGLALAAPDRPTYAVLGDLTFLHDSSGLLIGPDEPGPDLTIVVVNDDGGGIFTTLEPGEPARAAPFERLFGTPTGTDLRALCQAHGIRHEKVGSTAELEVAVASRPDGIRVVEITVDRGTHRAERDRLRALAADALAEPRR